jgi:hypothetical protein
LPGAGRARQLGLGWLVDEVLPAVDQDSLWGGSGAVLLESSLGPDCNQDSASETAPFWAEQLGELPPDSVSTRTDGGVLPDFIYAAPRWHGTPPPPESRRGYSEFLSTRGARTIQAGCEIARRSGTPMRAMWVFSVADEHLPDFLPAGGYDGEGMPEKTLGRELRRFWNLMSTWCRRNGYAKPEFLWAGESKSDGDRLYHPHAHCLTTLVVRRSLFEELCTTVERLWGLGSVHMETLTQPKSAARYCLKGVRYTVKGSDGDQGRVWGRRYGCSRAVRHHEERIAHEDSEAASDSIIQVAQRLRSLGWEKARTPYGVFSRRGFHPENGATWKQVTLAASLALSALAPAEPF